MQYSACGVCLTAQFFRSVSMSHSSRCSAYVFPARDSLILNKVENQSVDHSHTCVVILSMLGACRLEIISAPNDDVLEGDFEFSSGKDSW